MTERGSLFLLLNFLTGEAEAHFMYYEDIGAENSSGFTSYREATNCLPRTYAREEEIEMAVQAIDDTMLKYDESDLAFAERLR